MAEVKIAVGDEVRVHFHPPGAMKSYCEGVVSRVDVPTPEGRFFVVEVRNEVILDQPHRIRPGFPDFVRYECQNDFPGRIELLSTAGQDVERNHASDLKAVEPPEKPQHEAHEHRSGDVDVHSPPETERILKPEANSEPAPVYGEPQPVRNQGGLLAVLLGRKK
ncbi:hypothetical protein BB934_45005 (plasmid) [Microvirga ossetica]|uniref:Uncharacterized protein n=1 Tax=Microvirga ossetica TaxID=1882682 RepID=A0A1B2EZA8_9HYPH|nr:hypothetical protein [Microvirga ossetica]ANY85325.1 hypothetical protein BB934_45005 [Microvirga ossetica]